jgi:hypothetical protein
MVEEEDRGHGAWAAATARAVEVRSLYDLLARCRPRLAAAGHSGEIQTTWWILVYLGVRHSWRDPIVVRWGLLQHNVKVSGVCVLLKYRGGKLKQPCLVHRVFKWNLLIPFRAYSGPWRLTLYAQHLHVKFKLITLLLQAGREAPVQGMTGRRKYTRDILLALKERASSLESVAMAIPPEIDVAGKGLITEKGKALAKQASIIGS